MKRLLLIFIFCIAAFYSNAQLAIIQDPDGYVNLRAKPDVSSDILMKVTTADVFFCFEEEAKGDWYAADVYSNGEQNQFGYIDKYRVKFIYDYDSLSVSQLLKDKIVFKNKTIEVEIKTKPFDPKANTIEYTSEGASYRYVKTINHKKAWGTDGGIPRVAYEYVNVTIEGNKISLPKGAYDHLFEPTLTYMNVNYDVKNDILYIQGLNGDGAGGYIFAIIIKNKKFERTVTMIPF
ncbi:MAG TPA: hypothetical protein VK796_04470 [Cytophaga sp.]|nr:hypothetical protein [Cytophaga sp.]